jgi:hypothetical protein
MSKTHWGIGGIRGTRTLCGLFGLPEKLSDLEFTRNDNGGRFEVARPLESATCARCRKIAHLPTAK